MSSIERRVKQVISEQLGFPVEDVTSGKSFVGDLGASELDVIELRMAIEAEFETEISDEEAAKITTVQSAFDSWLVPACGTAAGRRPLPRWRPESGAVSYVAGWSGRAGSKNTRE